MCHESISYNFSSTLFTLYVHPIIIKYLVKNKTMKLLTTSSPFNILQLTCSAILLLEALQQPLDNNRAVSSLLGRTGAGVSALWTAGVQQATGGKVT